MHVLAIEDNPGDQEMLQLGCERFASNLKLSLASTGDEARAKLKEGHFDLILMDIHLGIENGIDLLEALRNEALLGETPAIVLTVSDDFADKLRAEEAGAIGFATKPASLAGMKLVYQQMRGLYVDWKLRQAEASFSGPSG